jgi:hypothetical protein
VPKTFEALGPDHPVAFLANAISDNAWTIAAASGVSRFQLCVAMANACGHILAGAGLPPAEAQDRIDALRTCMQGAYDLHDAEGEG